jgi:transcriptional regulator with XRE-family HTH domain
MARETTGMGLREFAEHIGVSPDTLTTAEKDRRKVRAITINAYALASGVDRDWLETGAGVPTPPGGPGKPRNDRLARLTEQKKGRARGSRTTRHYLPQFPLVPAAA